MTITRRSLLACAPAAAASLTIPAAIAVAEDKFDLQHWLDTADVDLVAHYHAARLTEAMAKIEPNRSFRYKIDSQAGIAMIVGDKVEAI